MKTATQIPVGLVVGVSAAMVLIAAIEWCGNMVVRMHQ